VSGRAYFVVVVEWKLLRHWLANELTCLECPCPRDVPHRVSATPENDNGHSEALDVAHAIGVPVHAQVEAAQSVPGETVAAALEDNGFWPVVCHDSFNGGFEDVLVGLVRDAVAEREVDGIVLASSNANVAKLAGAGEVLAVLVKRDRHDTIGGVKSFLDTVTMVHVDIDVQHALLVS
jgi:hypothetical protein